MKIAFITGGATFWNREREIIRELNKKNTIFLVIMDYHSINYNQNDIIEFCENYGIEFHIEDFADSRARSFKRIVRDFRLIMKIKGSKSDVIYIESFGSPYFAILNRLVLGNRRTIISIMDYILHQRAEKSFKLSERFYKIISVKLYKYFHFYSHSQKNYFQKDYPKKKAFVIRMFLVGTDIDITKVGVQNEKVNFLYFGRIFHYKGVDVLIKATNLLAQKYSNFVVTIAGNSKNWEQEYAPLISERDYFQLDIRFIPKEDIPGYFEKADFFVIPYREVTQSGPLNRAYNYNLIPIASNEDGFLEYITDNETGFIFENESPESLCKTMERALKMLSDEKERIINNVIEFKKNEFDIESIIKKYQVMFSSVCNRK